MLEGMSLFKGLGQKMGFLTMQQRVISQNITHADTPGYNAREVQSPNFKATMARYMNTTQIQQGKKLNMEATNGQHMTGKLSVGRAPNGEEYREVYEVAPGENAVVLEEQMIKSSEAAMQYQLTTNLYAKHIDMLRTAMRNR